MNSCHCFLPGPYTSDECIPWPKNEHEMHIIAVIWLVTWTLGIMAMLWMNSRAARSAEHSAQVRKDESNKIQGKEVLDRDADAL
jgi:hypothetical protein